MSPRGHKFSLHVVEVQPSRPMRDLVRNIATGLLSVVSNVPGLFIAKMAWKRCNVKRKL
ncbi:MAG: hypothetical protein LM590_12085 [Thermofilum sp.]|nr:hypothetical protein [Thermofilum sp.]